MRSSLFLRLQQPARVVGLDVLDQKARRPVTNAAAEMAELAARNLFARVAAPPNEQALPEQRYGMIIRQSAVQPSESL